MSPLLLYEVSVPVKFISTQVVAAMPLHSGHTSLLLIKVPIPEKKVLFSPKVFFRVTKVSAFFTQLTWREKRSEKDKDAQRKQSARHSSEPNGGKTAMK